MIKAIIFDYGGVLGENPSKKIYQRVAKEFGVGKGIIKVNFLKLIFQIQKDQIEEGVFWKKLAEKLKIKDQRRLRTVWPDEHQKSASINRELLSFIGNLKKKYTLCLLSNSARFYRNDSIEKMLKKRFHHIIYSFDVKMRKPERKIYRYLLKKINLKPADCLFIDDSKEALDAGGQMGMRTILFTTVPAFKKSLRRALSEETN